MRFKKSLNNNIALAEDAEGCEVIVIGTGVGFKKVKGQPIEHSQIQKTFRIGSNDKYQRVEQFLSDIPLQVIDITDQIIEEGREIIGKKLNDSILLTLADHIHFALDRFRKGVDMQNPLHWDIRHLYPAEYRAGELAVRKINEAFLVALPVGEAGSIALHFVNSQFDSGSMNQTIKITQMINDILGIMTDHFGRALNQESADFSRFITHLRYFIVRQMNREVLSFKDQQFLYDVLSERYPDSFQCALKIKETMEEQRGFVITPDEMVYLMIHIERVTSRTDTG
ncbi:PRD domain-containing protein [Paenibacillus polysaccharolyticus]|uniref:BglG family transcription antiterminator LicT n=1 Tax=Paenibacillus TaxID=44249 RepID=UPI0012B82624|nr:MULTISPECIES: PRD domain-containing protein [Paenibacillus]MCP1133874.1 PRD domain-containing protein [Paenibacillus polysaccharolyticus]